ncbi:MAG: DUF2207 domain-containing protein [Acidimicrobiales bacterium]|nr:DUF2207 domain-containing protein [Acidimicrobiales bacterium]
MNIRLRLRTAIVAAVVAVLAALAGIGVIGPAVGPERIAAYDVVATVSPEGDSVTVREVIDWDFGLSTGKHGIYRRIPNDAGFPQDLTVESPTASTEVVPSLVGGASEYRIGSASETVSGRHRYVITYTLPTLIRGDRFALDAIGNEWPVASHDVRIRILGATFDEPRCFTGPLRSTDRCPIEEVDGGYEVTLDELPANEAVTIDGDITARSDSTLPDLPPFHDRDGSKRLRWAAIVGALGALTAGAVYFACRQLGRNEVAGGGATDAAFVPFGDESFGPHHDAPDGPPPGTRMVADADMAELAGIEFVPPGGVEPWMASAVLRERIDERTIGAWFSALVARDVLDLSNEDGEVVMRPGEKAHQADPPTAAILNQLMPGGRELRLGSYDAGFASAWAQAANHVSVWVASSRTFRRRPPSGGGGAAAVTTVRGLGPALACLIVPFMMLAGGASIPVFGIQSAPAAVVLTVLVAGTVAAAAYWALTRSLTAKGSAIALRSESFRRFLHDSEAQHVEWAWNNGLLREYSAWAVALGEADAWNRAMAASSVPPPEQAASGNVMAPYIYASAFQSSHTAPAPSGGGGGGFSGGGFSGGGFSGGGGGGGGGGSW